MSFFSDEKINKTQEIALASLLHDVGKFIQRVEFFKSNSQGKCKKHSTYSSEFFSRIVKKYKDFFEYSGFNSDEINYAIKNHHNYTVDQKDILYFVRIGDHAASTQRIIKKEDEEEKQEEFDFGKELKRNAVPVVTTTSEDENIKFYDLLPYHQFIFSTLEPVYDHEREDINYLNNFWGFAEQKNFALIPSEIRNKEDKRWIRYLTILNFLTFIREIGFSVPADLREENKERATSLFTHLHIASAFSTAASLMEKSDDPEFLIFRFEINGIQKFIGDINFKSETKKNITKLLRGRSFFISVLENYISHLLAYNITGSPTSIIQIGGGNATLILPSKLEDGTFTKEVLRKIFADIGRFFLKHNIPLGLSFGYYSFKKSDLDKINSEDKSKDRLEELITGLFESLASCKKRPFAFLNYEDIFFVKNNFTKKKCSLCGAPIKENTNKCDLCRHLIDMGAEIVKEQRKDIYFRLIHFPKNLLSSIDDISSSLSKLLRITVSADEKETNGLLLFMLVDPLIFSKIMEKNIGGSKDFTEKVINLFKENGVIYYFKPILHTSLLDNILEEKTKVIDSSKEFLVHLVGDGDRMGEKISKISTISLDSWVRFSPEFDLLINRAYVDAFLESDILPYLVFMGGDDVYYIHEFEKGIDSITKFVKSITSFSGTTFSVGATLKKASFPIYLARLEASKNEKIAKKKRDSFCIWGSSIAPVNWDELKEIWDSAKELIEKTKNNNNSDRFGTFYYKLYSGLRKINNEIQDIHKKRTKFLIFLNYNYARWKKRVGSSAEEEIADKFLERLIKDLGNPDSLDKIYNKMILYFSFLSLLRRKYSNIGVKGGVKHG